jgi:GT2 family glycosyltransferase
MGGLLNTNILPEYPDPGIHFIVVVPVMMGNVSPYFNRILQIYMRMGIFTQSLRRNSYHYAMQSDSRAGDSEGHEPLISIIMPVHNGHPEWLARAIHSVACQLYPQWELCIVDDASSDRKTLKCLAGINSPRITIHYLDTNAGISIATNEGITRSHGKYITFLDQDDELTRDALLHISRAISAHHPDILYSDEDRFIEGFIGRRYLDANFKPDYSPDLLFSHNYITHLLVLHRELLDTVGGLRPEYDGAQDYDLVLRAVERAGKICHIRKVLYHWRQHSGSLSHKKSTRRECNDAGRRAVEDTVKRRGIVGTVEDTPIPNHYRVVREIRSQPEVTICIPFRDHPELLASCISSILQKTTYPRFEILGISNNSENEETYRLMKNLSSDNPKIRFIEYNLPFNYSAVNNHAASLARGEYLVLMNDDITLLTPTWIEALLEHAQRAEVGAVGGKLYYPDGTMQHAGIVAGVAGFAGRPHRRCSGESTGYMHSLMLTRNVSAVTGALMMVKRSTYLEAGGMDDVHLAVSLNDIDFCLRLLELGYWNVFTPYCEAVHHESVSRGPEDTPEKKKRFYEEIEYFTRRHKRILEEGDPFYNPNLSLDDENVRYSPEKFSGLRFGCHSF